MANLATQFISRTYQQPYRPAKSPEIAANRKAPLTARIDSYNDFIRAMAKKFTDSADEAEATFKVWSHDAKERTPQPTREEEIIALIAWRRLLKFLQ